MESIKQILQRGLYEAFARDYPETVNAIEQLLRLGESPEKITKVIQGRFPKEKSFIIGVIRHVADHAKTIQDN